MKMAGKSENGGNFGGLKVNSSPRFGGTDDIDHERRDGPPKLFLQIESNMKFIRALLTSVWVATTASSNQDQDNPPGAAVNDGVCSHLFSCMRHLDICHMYRH